MDTNKSSKRCNGCGQLGNLASKNEPCHKEMEKKVHQQICDTDQLKSRFKNNERRAKTNDLESVGEDQYFEKQYTEKGMKSKKGEVKV